MPESPDLPEFFSRNATPTAPPTQNLLLVADTTLVRAFRRELRSCIDCSVTLEVHESFEDAQQAGKSYHWVVVDLDGGSAPSEAVRRARKAWPNARLAVLSLCWSERDSIARDLADTVIHKPLRSVELHAFLRLASVDTPDVAVEPVPLTSSG